MQFLVNKKDHVLGIVDAMAVKIELSPWKKREKFIQEQKKEDVGREWEFCGQFVGKNGKINRDGQINNHGEI